MERLDRAAVLRAERDVDAVPAPSAAVSQKDGDALGAEAGPGVVACAEREAQRSSAAW